MTEISRSALFGRLDATALKAIETATGFCKMRGNPYVELVHWIHILMQDPRNDLALIRATFKLDDTKLARDIVEALDELPRGATAISDFSPQIEEAIEKGWLYASLQFSASRVRTGHLVYGMLKTPTLRNALFNTSTEFRKIQIDRLANEFDALLGSSSETTERGSEPAPEASTDSSGVPGGEEKALERYSVDLTAKARKGEIDPIVGRDDEIRQVIDILLRRRQNNPILVGEAGVGKTAVAEGFAKRIVDGDMPPALQGRDSARARHRPDAGRRKHEGRVRKAPAGRDRRGRIQPQADHPVHRRSAYLDRRRRAGRHGRCREPAQACPREGQAADDRRDHAFRISPIFREGSGAHPSVPDGRYRRAGNRQGDRT